jgi:hypothetical protein
LSNHLVYIRGGLGQSYTGCGWGFSESLAIAGYHTGCSLFRYRACQELDILTRATGHATTFYTNEMVQIKNNLETYLFDAGQNLFYAGTLNKTYNVDDNPELTITNHDVYMSAYAVVLGAGSTTVLDAVAWRLQGLTTTATTRAGMLAGFPAWEDTYTIRGGLMAQIPVGTYQGGGYWPEFTSWVARAIRRVNQRSADRLMEDLAGRYAAQSAATVPYEAEDTLDSGGGTGRLCIWIRRACRSCIGQQMLSNDENESRSPPNATLRHLRQDERGRCGWAVMVVPLEQTLSDFEVRRVVVTEVFHRGSFNLGTPKFARMTTGPVPSRCREYCDSNLPRLPR